MAYSKERKINDYVFHLANVPVMLGERQGGDFLRAFRAMTADTNDVGRAIEAAEDAINYVAGEAFRRGFEACHAAVVVPLQESTVGKTDVKAAMRRHGELVRRAIVERFEDVPGAPNALTVDIEDVPLPDPVTGWMR